MQSHATGDSPAQQLRAQFATAFDAHQAGRLDEAEQLYLRVLSRAPNHPDTLHLLGVISIERKQFDRAIDLITNAVRRLPAFADAHLNLGNAYRGAGKLEKAEESYRRAIAIKPGFAVAHSNLGRVLVELNRSEEAVVICARAIELDPKLIEAQVNLATALARLRRWPEAEAAYRQAIALRPDDAQLVNDLASLLGEMERFDEAINLHRKALELSPQDPLIHQALGATLFRSRDMCGSEASYRRAIDLSPELATAWNALGRTLRAVGRFDEAVDRFRKALSLKPDLADAFRNLAATGQHAANQAEIERLDELAKSSDAPAEDRVAAGFALGKMLDDADRFDEAFASYHQANDLYKSTRAAAGQWFDPQAMQRQVDRLIEIYSADHFTSAATSGIDSPAPVFIVGMPRSGTSLVEQIAASHPKVFGAGELKDIGKIESALGLSGDVPNPDSAKLSSLAAEHLDRLRSLGGGAGRIIDKLPDNVFQLGLIHALFPKARVILCRRDPRDTCLSCYFQLFTTGNLFSYDLADCGRRHVETDRLIAHWKRVLPMAMFEIEYEKLVANLEAESRRLIEFLGLEWDPACLAFHQTNRAVVTASTWQVRQPLYSRSVGRWRHYERHLRPLFAQLGSADSAISVIPPKKNTPGRSRG